MKRLLSGPNSPLCGFRFVGGAKFVFSISLLGFLCLMLPGSLQADTIYTYTGDPYSACGGTYTCNGTTPFLTVTIDVVAGTPLDNLTFGAPGSDISADVSSYSFTDGTGLDITSCNGSGPLLFVATVGTNASGAITTWAIGCNEAVGPGGVLWIASTNGNPAGCEDASETIPQPTGTAGSGYGYGCGTWTMESTTAPPTNTPEQSSCVLLSTGLLCLLGLAARSKCHAPPAS